MIRSKRNKNTKLTILPLIKISLLVIFCLGMFFLLKIKVIQVYEDEQIRPIFPVLISSSAIIVSILVGYFLNKLVEVKNQTTNLRIRFIELQGTLYPYLQAFHFLARDLVDRFHIDAQYPKPYAALRGDAKFWENEQTKPSATIFVRDLYESSSEYYFYQDYETDGRLISTPKLFSISYHLSNLSGTLERRKHYKHVLREFGFDENAELRNVIIASPTGGFKNLADVLDPNPSVRWDSLSFWEDQINKALEIVEKMIANRGFRSPVFLVYFRSTFTLLGLVLFFGTLLPIFLMSFSLPAKVQYFLSYLSVIGFVTSLVTVLNKIFSEVINEMKGFA